MAIQQIGISDWILKLGSLLKNNVAIRKFTAENFPDKQLMVVAGDILPDEEPVEEDCPFILIYGATKKEGLNAGVCEYKCNLGIGISTDKGNFLSDDGIVMHNAYDLMSKLMLIIQRELNDYRPMSAVDAQVGGALNPGGTYWAGDMTIIWEIEQTLGLGKAQEF